mmetsp:Transcript_3599/g.4669  ORF Transcript_3599/g.4669 Transcript_3599/m.4669 type:complete len:83 (-) Transcript_3599:8-256(-)
MNWRRSQMKRKKKKKIKEIQLGFFLTLKNHGSQRMVLLVRGERGVYYSFCPNTSAQLFEPRQTPKETNRKRNSLKEYVHKKK